TLAVLGNLVFVVYGTMQRAQVPTGVDESRIGLIQSIGVIGFGNTGTIVNDIAVLRAVPNVVAATYGGPPLWYVQQDSVFDDPAHQQKIGKIYEFQGSQGLSQTLGVHIVRGRNLEDNDLPSATTYTPTLVLPVLVTQALAQHLFPHGNALGSVFY
ncbi:hypothetical protein WHJ98_14435, partial [Staphylococcus aureus]|uniref:hypothetical protein n=1 Tax=Staphylococcus aureus TaxID=1280 RepID=UPI0039BDAB89